MTKKNIHRDMVTKAFREYMERQGIKCIYTDGEEIEDGDIMCLYGCLRTTWDMASDKKNKVQK